MTEQHRLIGSSSQTWSSLVDKARLNQGTISTSVVIRECRINDGADGLVGNLPDGGESLRAHLLVARVDKQYTLGTALNSDVRARSSEELNITLNFQCLDLEL